jgi:hypothetical protein
MQNILIPKQKNPVPIQPVSAIDEEVVAATPLERLHLTTKGKSAWPWNCSLHNIRSRIDEIEKSQNFKAQTAQTAQTKSCKNRIFKETICLIPWPLVPCPCRPRPDTH